MVAWCLLTGAVVVSNQRAAHGFQAGQKLEVVDRRNPMLIRVATVTETEDFRLKVELRPTGSVASRDVTESHNDSDLNRLLPLLHLLPDPLRRLVATV